ncbi:FmdE family protein [Lysobacter sp. H23M47]|uniref:FmdE family protein n=1 Tax=Lysobacter sp. H23M47 TaxID=2781024 RepID=UPI00187FCF7B|nr:FmdE family protein [Lysobacter sp. H23M47]QOW23458.1 hypothetical protein INQ43_06525 [Lysobacter sp. H23M47]
MIFPAFFEQAPVVKAFDPLAKLLGAPSDGCFDYVYADAVRFSGHSCPTVAGSFLMGRAAMQALYPEGRAERGQIEVSMGAPAGHGTTGVMAQVLTLLTGAAAENGFKGIGGSYARNGLLTFAEHPESGAVTFRRRDTGELVIAELDTSPVPGNPNQRGLLIGIMQGVASDSQKRAFAEGWQERVRTMLVDLADDPRLIRLKRVEVTPG